jgi:hypothetical protein
LAAALDKKTDEERAFLVNSIMSADKFLQETISALSEKKTLVSDLTKLKDASAQLIGNTQIAKSQIAKSHMRKPAWRNWVGAFLAVAGAALLIVGGLTSAFGIGIGLLAAGVGLEITGAALIAGKSRIEGSVHKMSQQAMTLHENSFKLFQEKPNKANIEQKKETKPSIYTGPN